MKNAYLICYKFERIRPEDRVKFTREMFGSDVQSHRGKYKYKTRGALQDYEKPVRSVVIVPEEERIKAKNILNKYHAEVFIYKILRIA